MALRVNVEFTNLRICSRHDVRLIELITRCRPRPSAVLRRLALVHADLAGGRSGVLRTGVL